MHFLFLHTNAFYHLPDRVTILYSCTQAPFEIRSMLAKILDKPEENIRVIVTPLGGGFGKKCDSFLEAPAGVGAHARRKR